jgi:hypothetical protein
MPIHPLRWPVLGSALQGVRGDAEQLGEGTGAKHPCLRASCFHLLIRQNFGPAIDNLVHRHLARGTTYSNRYPSRVRRHTSSVKSVRFRSSPSDVAGARGPEDPQPAAAVPVLARTASEGIDALPAQGNDVPKEKEREQKKQKKRSDQGRARTWRG